MKVLVINCGSSSIKHRLFAMPEERELCRGAVEGIDSSGATLKFLEPAGDETSEPIGAADHAAALAAICDRLEASGLAGDDGPDAVAHRVVHGGDRFEAATGATDAVLAEVERLEPLAPLHNPVNLLGVRLARERYPGARHALVFDTAFHQTLPPHAAEYAIPRDLAREHGVRRYGFHGTSHRWASRRAAELLDRPLEALRTVVLHLGAGASAAAVAGGRSVDTSMGMTPLAGLVMATRSGDIDPGALLYLQREAGLAVDEVDRLLNRQSGLAGLCGEADLRRVLERADAGDADARLAIDAYVYRIAKQVGAYAVALGGLDAVAFTAGVGERSPAIRAAVAERLSCLGVTLDARANGSGAPADRTIHAADSRVALLVVTANEELQIAREATELLNES